MSLYKEYQEKLRKIADVENSIALLGWDQETHLPKDAAELRGQQIATLSGIAYELSVEPELGKLLEKLKDNTSLSEREQKNIELSLKDYQKRLKYNKEFVIKMSKATSLAFQTWAEARKKDDFSIYEPALTAIVNLKREEAELLGYEDHVYDALLDQFEPGAKTKDITALFADVRNQLVEFVKEIGDQPQISDQWMTAHYDKDEQWEFGIGLLKQMGYNFDRGRQDLSTHPFTTDFGPTDVRVTTRISESDFNEMTWSCIHEGGHALYEQGLRVEDYGLPTGSYISLGIHESQSRLWENNVGRGIHYWKANYPELQKRFSSNLKNVSVEDFYKSTNKVQASFIRTNADELTYHFHVLIRFEIEKALIEGSIEVKDIPTMWNAKYKEYLGIDVPSDSMGCLQDIHWSHGSFGYFPTYSLGSFYAAQFYHFAKQEIEDLEGKIVEGNMIPLLDWLRDKVHQHGKMYTAEELCIRITGEKLNFKYFMDYAKAKYAGIYNLSVADSMA